MGWQQSLNVHITQSDLGIQCNLHQNSVDILRTEIITQWVRAVLYKHVDLNLNP